MTPASRAQDGEPRGLLARVAPALRRVGHAARSRLLLGGAVVCGPARDALAITFDDGPSPAYTPAILATLRERGVRATFFLLGAHVEAHPDLARAIADEHEIGCHSYGHERSMVASLASFERDLARCREVLGRIGVSPRWYRFPWGARGAIDPRAIEARFGMACVHWSASSGDDTLEPDAIVARLSPRLDPGGILLFHDGVAPGSIRRHTRDATIAALPRVLDLVASRGLRATSVGALLGGEGEG
jgi:peptidoglycan/xylan/chitin deacetylase (PgdA/CDA1 family)